MTITKIRKNQQGFSLVEVAIVLVIAGIIIAGIWLAVSTVNKERKLTTTKRQILELVDNVQKYSAKYNMELTGTNRNPTAQPISDTRIMHAAGLFPPELNCDMAGAQPDCDNLYRGDYLTDFAEVVGQGATGRTQLTIHINGLPLDACANLVTTFIGNPDFMGLAQTFTTDTNLQNSNRYTPAQAIAYCNRGENAGPAGSNFSVNLRFRL